MNILSETFSQNGGFHMGCLFHFKQALQKYLIKKCGLGFSKVHKEAMVLGGLDILCILPRNEIEKFGIPYLRYILELGLQQWEKEKLDTILRPYFKRQWIPIMQSWNLIGNTGAPLEIVNCTNNALESYNRRFNKIFSKQPVRIEFTILIEIESRHQAQIRQDIITGRKGSPKGEENLDPWRTWIIHAVQGRVSLSGRCHSHCRESTKSCTNSCYTKVWLRWTQKDTEDDNNAPIAATSKGGCKKVEEGEGAAPLKKQGRKAAAMERQDIAEPVIAEKWVKRLRKTVNYVECKILLLLVVTLKAITR